MKLTAAARNKLPGSVFALPGRRFPIHDKIHARVAKSYASRMASRGQLSPSQKAAVFAKANKKLGLRAVSGGRVSDPVEDMFDMTKPAPKMAGGGPVGMSTKIAATRAKAMKRWLASGPPKPPSFMERNAETIKKVGAGAAAGAGSAAGTTAAIDELREEKAMGGRAQVKFTGGGKLVISAAAKRWKQRLGRKGMHARDAAAQRSTGRDVVVGEGKKGGIAYKPDRFLDRDRMRSMVEEVRYPDTPSPAVDARIRRYTGEMKLPKGGKFSPEVATQHEKMQRAKIAARRQGAAEEDIPFARGGRVKGMRCMKCGGKYARGGKCMACGGKMK